MRQYLELTPAYGRDYKSQKEVLEAWNAGKDFILQPQGVPMNNEDYAKMLTANPDGVVLNIRYKQLRQVCVVQPKKAKK